MPQHRTNTAAAVLGQGVETCRGQYSTKKKESPQPIAADFSLFSAFQLQLQHLQRQLCLGDGLIQRQHLIGGEIVGFTQALTVQ